MKKISNEDIYEAVREAYNTNSYYEKYRASRVLTRQEQSLMDKICKVAKEGNKKVIDIGCGDGALYDRYLIDNGCALTGIDISEKQIELAKKNVPTGNYICVNWLDVDKLLEDPVQAIICMYAFFNFYEKDRVTAATKIYDSLRQNGSVLINVRKEVHEGIKYAESWCGKPMWWDLPGVDTIIQDFIGVGFTMECIEENTENPDYVFIWFSKKLSKRRTFKYEK